MNDSDVKNPTLITPVDQQYPWVEAGSIASPLRVLVLRHPKEKKAKLGTAELLKHTLQGVTLKTGLSWRNLRHALGDEAAEHRRWAVLFLGTKKNFSLDPNEVLGLFDSKGKRADIATTPLDGIVALDGTWRDVKGMWWKNSWLLKLWHIQLNPTARSLYGEMRKAPRKENLSTLEAVAMTLANLTNNPEIENKLGAVMQEFLRSKR